MNDKFSPQDKQVYEDIELKYGSMKEYLDLCNKNEKIDCKTLKKDNGSNLPPANEIIFVIKTFYKFKRVFDYFRKCIEWIGGLMKQAIQSIFGADFISYVQKLPGFNLITVPYKIYQFGVRISDFTDFLTYLDWDLQAKKQTKELFYKFGILVGDGIKIGVSFLGIGKRKVKRLV